MADKKQRVVVVGASPDPKRYSHRAVCLLMEYGHEVIPVNPSAPSIAGLPAVTGVSEIDCPVDTITLYVSARVSSALAAQIKRLHPGRVIFNPGAENPSLRDDLEEQGIHTQEACTLVLLNTQQF